MTTRDRSTVGPWYVGAERPDRLASGEPSIAVNVDGPHGIAYTVGPDRARHARLIAAAPALLEVASRTLETLSELPTDCGEGSHRGGSCCFATGGDRDVRAALEVAIARATGDLLGAAES